MGDELEKEHRKRIPESVQSKITFMVHDFFKEQPIKNADVYFFRCTLHNWSDEFVVKVLRALIPALKPGARVVIQDNGLANPGTIGLSDEISQRYVVHSRCDISFALW
jgi:chemotaxis methyl-accepting protein methylase